MLIAIAGPDSAETAEQRRHNLDALNKVAAAVMMRGHIPVIGVNAALPVLEWLEMGADQYESMMAISLALVDKCEAILILARQSRLRDGVLKLAQHSYHLCSHSRGVPVPHLGRGGCAVGELR